MSTYTGVDQSRITLEVSGGAAIVESAVPMDIQSRLRMRGVGLSLDEANVGGVSGIELIKHFPFTEIKMDLRALHALDHYDASSRVIQHIIDLAHSMQVKVVAMGIETLSTLTHLRLMRCDIVQGYCISRAIPLGELIPWMKTNFHFTTTTKTALPGG
jgi:EAL domain-containing protein (putative c-di-GMP-specific phosphodiesterase class I)